MLSATKSTLQRSVYLEAALSNASGSSCPGPGVPYEFHGREPPKLHLSRGVDVGREDWDVFCNRSLGRSASGVFSNFFQTQDTEDFLHTIIPDDEHPRHIVPKLSITNCAFYSHKSVVGLPVLNPYSHQYLVWSFIINLVDATYTAFLIPFIVAFIDRSDERMQYLTSILELFFGSLFLADVIVNFHVGFVIRYDYKKKIIMDGKSVAWYYLKHGGFWIDFLSVFPFFFEVGSLVIIGFEDQTVLVTILRLFRLLRIYRILKRMFGGSIVRNTIKVGRIQIPPTVVYLASVVYSMLLMINLLGCALFIIAEIQHSKLENTWVFKYISGTHDVPDGNDPIVYIVDVIDSYSQFELYVISIYWAVTTVTTVGYGDITPESIPEMILISIVMLSHIMLFGLLIGSISELVKSSLKSARNQEALREKIDCIGRWMTYRNLSHSTVRKINAFYAEIVRQSNDFEEEEILQELPLPLRVEVVSQVTKALMVRLPVFHNVSFMTLQKLAGRLIPITLPPGRELIRQGDVSDALYILEEGRMGVVFNESVVYYVNGPETCGESSILSSFIPRLTHHPVTLRTCTSCSLWKLYSKELAPVFAMDAELRDALIEGFRRRLLRTFATGIRSGDLEIKIEAEFGCKLTTIQAIQFKAALERSKVKDGTFRRLIEDLATEKFVTQLARRSQNAEYFDDNDELSSALFSVEEEDKSIAPEERELLTDLIQRIRQEGEFGMIKFVSALKRITDDQEKLDLDGLRQVSASFSYPFTPRSLLTMFTLFDRQDTGFVAVNDIIGALRSLVNFKYRERHIQNLFSNLDLQERISDERGDGVLNMAELIRSFRVENHPDVLTGALSMSRALNQFVTAIGHEDVSYHVFMDFHRDLSMCVEDDARFEALTDSLWAVSNTA